MIFRCTKTCKRVSALDKITTIQIQTIKLNSVCSVTIREFSHYSSFTFSKMRVYLRNHDTLKRLLPCQCATQEVSHGQVCSHRVHVAQLQWFSERGVCSHSSAVSCRNVDGWHEQEGCIREKANWRAVLVQAGMFAESQQSEEVQRVEKKCWCDEDLKTDGHFRRLVRKMSAIGCASVHISDGMSFTNWQGYASKGGGVMQASFRRKKWKFGCRNKK